MKLTRQSIIQQLRHELLEWKALNLRPEAMLGTRNPRAAYQLYSHLLSEPPFMPPQDLLEQLYSYVFLRSVDSEFFRYFGVYDPKIVNLFSLPLNPYFCATSLFHTAIEMNTIPSRGYDDAAQVDLIRNNIHFAYPSDASHLHGVKIAAETHNEEMLSFLLHPSFSMFDLTNEYQQLLDNPLVTHPTVREVIFRACGQRFAPEMLEALIERIKTTNEWIALFQALGENHRQALLNRTTPELWTRLQPSDAQIKMLLPSISEEAAAQLYSRLVSASADLSDAQLILSLMDRMPTASRKMLVLRMEKRVNTVFSQPAERRAYLDLLGYSLDANNHITLNHMHVADRPVLNEVQLLNQVIWDSTLDFDVKLRYFHVTQQLLLVNPDGRLESVRAYEDCIEYCESVLRDQADAGLNWFWRMLNVLGRFLGFVSDFPVTLQARQLLMRVDHAVGINPNFHAVILDLSRVILPNEAPESQRRKDAIGYLSSSNYKRFWATMTSDERASLFSDQARFQQLLQTFADEASIEQLMLGLSESMRDELIDHRNTPVLLSLLQMPRVSMPTLLGCLGDARKNQLLRDPVWFGHIMTQLPDSVTRSVRELIDRHIFDEIKNSLPHIQSALIHADLSRLPSLGLYFAPSIPLNQTPQEIGFLMESIQRDKLIPFWRTFLSGRVITVAEMAQLVPIVNDVEKRRILITHQLSLSPITVWSDDLFVLLPNMTPEQQEQILSVMTDDDLLRLNREGHIERMMEVFELVNHEMLLDRYRTVFSEPTELNLFLDQLLPEHLQLLLSKPPFEFFKIMAEQDLLGLIRALRQRSDQLQSREQWQIFAPKLLEMALSIYGGADPVVTLLQKHVPKADHLHVLNLLHEASDDAIHYLFAEYLNTDIVQALMLHKEFDFNAMTLDNIQKIMDADPNVDNKPELIALADDRYHRLIQSHLLILNTQVDQLVIAMNTGNASLLALMVPSKGFFSSYSFTKEIQAQIILQWDDMVNRIQKLTAHHAELVRLCSFRHYDEAMVALKPIHQKISDLAVSPLSTFIVDHTQSVSKTNLKLKYPDQEVDAIYALEQVKQALQHMDENEEARLLAAIPDDAITHKMIHAEQLKDSFDQIVIEANQAGFLERCRNLLTTRNLWHELTPSSLALLSNRAPRAMFTSVSAGDFKSLVRAFNHLRPEQWDAIATHLWTLCERYFHPEDVLKSMLQKDVQLSAHTHVLNLIRVTPEEDDVSRLMNYFQSAVVREYKQHNDIDDAAIEIAHLPQLENDALHWFLADVKSKENKLKGHIEDLKTLLGELKTELDAPKKTGWTFFSSSSYDFNSQNINSKLAEVAQMLDQFTQEKVALSRLNSIHSDESSDEFMNSVTTAFQSEFLNIREFMNSEGGKSKLKEAPYCIYREKTKMLANDCLTAICAELNNLASNEDELDMSTTLSGSVSGSYG